MGYFSNGTEHMMYDDQYCSKCHFQPDYEAEKDCPILAIHSMFNYDQHNEDDRGKELKWILDLFIPIRENGFSDQCHFFIEKRVHEQTTLFTNELPKIRSENV